MTKIASNNLLGKRLLFLIAHPDDESFLASATIYANHQKGGNSCIICATLGERGKAHLKRPVSLNQLKQIRKKELLAVSKLLKVNSLCLLAYPDKKVNDFTSVILKKSLKIAKLFKPDMVLSFGPDGITGHLDHIAMSHISKRVAEKLNKPFLAFAAAPTIIKDSHDFKARRHYGTYKDTVSRVRSNLRIKAKPGLKLKAISMHKSQLEDNNPFKHIPPKAISEIKNFDYYVAP